MEAPEIIVNNVKITKENINEFELGLNRRHFAKEIIQKNFLGDIHKCAQDLCINTQYLLAILQGNSKKAGIITLTKIFRYCIKNDYNPMEFIIKKS